MSTTTPSDQQEAMIIASTALATLIAYFVQDDPMDYVYAKRNADDCWYPPVCAILTDYLPWLANSAEDDYSKGDALADSSSAINSLFQDYKDALPTIYNEMCIANGFNSTSQQLLADSAFSKVTTKASEMQLNWITQYQTISANLNSAIANIISASKNSLSVGSVSNIPSSISPQQAILAGMHQISQLTQPSTATNPAVTV